MIISTLMPMVEVSTSKEISNLIQARAIYGLSNRSFLKTHNRMKLITLTVAIILAHSKKSKTKREMS